MTSNLLNIKARNLEAVRYILEGLEGTRIVGVVTEAVAGEIVDIMQSQPEETPYQYVSRAEAYPNAPAGPGWFSDKQRRYVMAAIRSGAIQIPYRRTGQISGAWQVEGRLSKARAVNNNAAAPYVFGQAQQSNHENLVGWQKIGERLDKYANRIFDAAYLAMRQYIDSRRRNK